MTDEVGVAILGCGYWGINYVRVFSELSHARAVVACDTKGERLKEVERRFPGVVLASRISDALQVTGVDAVVVCTDASTHYEVARHCLMAGKHTLIEKPMTTTVSDARALVDLAEARGLTLMAGHVFLYNSGVRKVKEYIAQNKLGRLYYLYASRTNLGPFRRDVNALWDLAAHDISIFNYLLDSAPRWVSAVGCKVLRNGHEDVGFISIGYDDDIVGHIHVSWANPNKVREVVVVGSDMRIVFDDLNNLEKVRVFEKGVVSATTEASSYGEYHFLVRDGDIVSPRIEVSEPLKNQCSHFLECVMQGSRPLTSGWEGLLVVKVMAAIDDSIAHKGTPIEIA